jgi:hypothetical protein
MSRRELLLGVPDRRPDSAVTALVRAVLAVELL